MNLRSTSATAAIMLGHAGARARRRAPALNASVFHFLRDVLLLTDADDERRELVRKLQQVTGPVTAKAIEDTTFYIYNRLVSLNEVGGDPTRFGVPVERFHQLNRHRLEHWPGSLNATATHDTKRGEDTRLRIDELSVFPVVWVRRIEGWRRLNAAFKRDSDGVAMPDANDELLLYQTLVGVWDEPGADLTDRLVNYMKKATMEAKVHTSWTAPDEAYDSATEAFVRAVVDLAAVSRRLRAVCRGASPTPLDCRRSASSSSSWDRPASPTSTRARSCGTWRWSTPTTGRRSTSAGARGLLDGSCGGPSPDKLLGRVKCRRPARWPTAAPSCSYSTWGYSSAAPSASCFSTVNICRWRPRAKRRRT